MDNLRYRAHAAGVYLHSRAFAVTMLALSMAATLMWLSTSTNAVYIRDGSELTLVYTTKEQPHEILEERGIITMAYDDVDFNGFGTDTVAEINITRAFDVTLTVGGNTRPIKVTGGTVGDLLRDHGIAVEAQDILSHPEGMFLAPGDDIVYQKVSANERVVRETIPFETEYKGSTLIKKGKTRVIQSGRAGEREIIYRQTIVDGAVTEEELVSDVVLSQPQKQIILQGTADPISPLDFGVPTDANGRPLQYSKVLTNQVATGYSAGKGAWGASGMDLFYGYVAVDYREIPYGTKMYIASPDNSFIYGYAIAADTGTGLIAGVIDVDLYYETYIESCLNGRRTVDIYILN